MNYRNYLFIIAVAALLPATLLATKYAGDFEELGTSARAIGMGGAAVTVASDPSAIYYNPSLSTRITRTAILLMHSEDFSGLVKHNFLGIGLPGKNQALGMAILHNGIPGIKLTELPDTTQPPGENNRPYVKKIVSANQLVTYFNYARTINPVLSLGGNVKLIYQDLGGTANCFGMGIDLGAIITPITEIDIGLRVRNLSTSPLFWNTGSYEYIYPRGAVGISKLFRFGRDRLRLAVESELDFVEKNYVPNFGVEYVFRNVLAGRLGIYRHNISFGVGFRFRSFHIDYGYAAGAAPEARELGSPQQFSGGVEF